MSEADQQPRGEGESSRRLGGRRLWPIVAVVVAVAAGGAATHKRPLNDSEVQQVREVVESPEFDGKYGPFLPHVVEKDTNLVLLTPKGDYSQRLTLKPETDGRASTGMYVELGNIPPDTIVAMEFPKDLIPERFQASDDSSIEVMRLRRGTVLMGPFRHSLEPYLPDGLYYKDVESDLQDAFRERGLNITVTGLDMSMTRGTVVELRERSLLQKMLERDDAPARHERHDVQGMQHQLKMIQDDLAARLPPQDGRKVIARTGRRRI